MYAAIKERCRSLISTPGLCTSFVAVVILGICYLTATRDSRLSYKSSIPSTSLSPKQIGQRPKPRPLPHQHVCYLKTGSTSMLFILAEYCRTHDLLPLLPAPPECCHLNRDPSLKANRLMLFERIQKYDIVFNHYVFTSEILGYLHQDSFLVTSLRQPFEQFISAFYFFKNKYSSNYLNKIRGADPVIELLLDPAKYEADGYESFTNNRQSMDFGYNISRGFSNITYIKEFINEADKRFDFVMITEFFDESLVILKRALHWNTEDILYIRKNKRKPRLKTYVSPEKEELRRDLHAKVSKPDLMLYRHFLKRFKQRREREEGLDEEVAEFKQILVRVLNYCYNSSRSSESLTIQRGQWNNAFRVTPYRCKWLMLNAGQLMTEQLQDMYSNMFNW